MTGSLGMVLAVSVSMSIMLLGMASAKAASGRIVLSGAVAEPTCSVEGDKINAASRSRQANGFVVARATCGRTSTDPGRSYSHRVVALEHARIADDRLLAYFASYANGKGATQARLVIRTYE